MKKTLLLTASLTLASLPSFSQNQSTGPYVVPSTAAYALLDNAAASIVTDNGLAGKKVVIFDPGFFTSISSYQTAVFHLNKMMASVCPSVRGGFQTEAIVPTLDFGGAASGLAALITALTPSYATQGGQVPIDTTALVAAVASSVGPSVIYPAYVLPASKRTDLSCNNYSGSTSIADLWNGLSNQVIQGQVDNAPRDGDSEAIKKEKKAKQDVIDAVKKSMDTYVAVDKGPSVLSKLLVVENFFALVGDSAKVIDLKLDLAGSDSVTRTWVGIKSTKASANVLAHYSVLNLTVTPATKAANLTLCVTKTVSVFTQLKSIDKFAESATPKGMVNGKPVNSDAK
jgi:hypothetical protein